MMEKNADYILHPSVFYRHINEKLVLYKTDQSMIFSFNSFAGDIFDFFVQSASIDDLFIFLKEKYFVDGTEIDLESELKPFLEKIIHDKIIVRSSMTNEYSGMLENEISDEYANAQKLYSVTIELTYRCNEKCRHCYVHDDGGVEMNTEQVKNILDDLYDMGVPTILFTGGEVFLREDIFEILEYAYKKNFAVDIFTNGTLLNGDKILKIKSLWPKGVHFSVYSFIAEKHDAITQIKGSFNKTIDAIKACKLVGIPVKIKTPVFSETIDDINGVIALANSIGIPIGISSDLTIKKNGDPAPLSMRIIGEKMYENLQKDIEKQLGDLYKPNRQSKALHERICSAGLKMISINPYGKVFPCVSLPICVGDATKKNIKDIWNNSDKLCNWRRLNKVQNRIDCLKCEHLDFCRFCPGEAMMYTKNPILKYEDACYVTKTKKNFSAAKKTAAENKKL